MMLHPFFLSLNAQRKTPSLRDWDGDIIFSAWVYYSYSSGGSGLQGGGPKGGLGGFFV